MLKVNFTPFPVLQTERLLLRRIQESDAKGLLALRSNPVTMKYIPRPIITTQEEVLFLIAMMDEKINSNDGINWAITLKENDEFIGYIGHYRIQPEHFRSEIGYMMLPDFQGKGYGTEAINKVVEYGFHQMQLHSIEAVIDPNNGASEKALQKCGFVKEAHFKENEYFDGKFIDSVVYSKLNTI